MYCRVKQLSTDVSEVRAASIIARMMKAARTSETSADNYFTRQYIPEDKSEVHTRRRENFKSHDAKCVRSLPPRCLRRQRRAIHSICARGVRNEDLICITRNQQQRHCLFSFPSMVLHSIASFRIYGKTCVLRLSEYSLPSTLLTSTSLNYLATFHEM
jgi:hypothetical protein